LPTFVLKNNRLDRGMKRANINKGKNLIFKFGSKKQYYSVVDYIHQDNGEAKDAKKFILFFAIMLSTFKYKLVLFYFLLSCYPDSNQNWFLSSEKTL
jgi:hypothetical protein